MKERKCIDFVCSKTVREPAYTMETNSAAEQNKKYQVLVLVNFQSCAIWC